MGEGGGGGGEGCESEAVRVKCGDVKGYGAVCANGQEANRDTTTETEVKVRKIDTVLSPLMTETPPPLSPGDTTP